MVTDQFLTNFFVETITIAPTDEILISIKPPVIEGASITGQIVKADFRECTPGLRFLYSNNLDTMIIGFQTNLTIEEPTDEIMIYPKSLIFPEEDISGYIDIYYWYPDTILNETETEQYMNVYNITDIINIQDNKTSYVYIGLIPEKTQGIIKITNLSGNSEEIIITQDLEYDFNELEDIKTIELIQNVYANAFEELKGGTEDEELVVLE